MNTNTGRFFDRFRQDRTFWLIIGAIVLLYVVLQWSSLIGVVISLVGLVIAITVHEFAHAWAANQLDDPTARQLGRLTLNPLAHLDPLGSVMILITVFTGFGLGWGKPVPVAPHRLKYGPRKGTMLVSLAGPLANLLVALVFGLAMRLLVARASALSMVYVVLQTIVTTNIIIALFNLLPLPPLDGHSVLLGLLSFVRQNWAWRVSQFIESWSRHGWLILFGVIIVSQLFRINIFGVILGPPFTFFYRLFVG
jgi:Zn-dependent protease